jgi:hypothetical protein
MVWHTIYFVPVFSFYSYFLEWIILVASAATRLAAARRLALCRARSDNTRLPGRSCAPCRGYRRPKSPPMSLKVTFFRRLRLAADVIRHAHRALILTQGANCFPIRVDKTVTIP